MSLSAKLEALSLSGVINTYKRLIPDTGDLIGFCPLPSVVMFSLIIDYDVMVATVEALGR